MHKSAKLRVVSFGNSLNSEDSFLWYLFYILLCSSARYESPLWAPHKIDARTLCWWLSMILEQLSKLTRGMASRPNWGSLARLWKMKSVSISGKSFSSSSVKKDVRKRTSAPVLSIAWGSFALLSETLAKKSIKLSNSSGSISSADQLRMISFNNSAVSEAIFPLIYPTCMSVG